MGELDRLDGKAPAKKAAKKTPAKKAAKKGAKKLPPKKVPPKKVPPKKGPHGEGRGRSRTRESASPSPTMALPAPPTDPLSILGLAEAYSPAQLRRAWRLYASRHHPDQGGDAAMFTRGRAAYEALLQGDIRLEGP